MEKNSPYSIRVGGLAFAPTEAQRKRIKAKGFTLYLGLDSWFDDGRKDNSIIYDHAGAFADIGVPIIDATYTLGIYHRCEPNLDVPRIKAPKRGLTAPFPTKHTDDDHIVLSKHGIITISDEATAAASGHGKMSRGAGHRSKKPEKN